jgi:PEP-CTERM motif
MIINKIGAAVLLVLATISAAQANAIFYSGNLRANANITGCGLACTLAVGDTDVTWAQWAAFSTPFTLVNPGAVNAITFGYAGGTSATGAVVVAGGLEPYLSLFDASGNFLMSTFNGINCPPGAATVSGNCFDVELDAGTLAAGSYTLVLSAYQNMSSAENLGTGKLADGMSGLGNLGLNENLNYAFDLNISGQPAPVPEPGTMMLVLAGVALVAARRPS